MIDIKHVRKIFSDYINRYDNKSDLGFSLKVVHTMHVVENAKYIAKKMNLSEEDIELAELIAFLHDIGRFDELKLLKSFDNSGCYDHALCGVNILFENNYIRDFISDDSYDDIIKKAIGNHNKLYIESGLSERELLHAKIIRDADKLDNFRVKVEEPIEAIFPGIVKTIEEFNNSLISDKVYQNVLNRECVDVHDRVYPLDYWICILAFIFDINFKETFEVIKDNNYVNVLIDRFNYTNPEIKNKMENIREIMNNYVSDKLNKEV